MRYSCVICGYLYDEDKGIPDRGISAGTKFEDLPSDWVCPICGAPKSAFRPVEDAPVQEQSVVMPIEADDSLREMSFGELGAMCSNLALGCEKQQLSREKELFTKLSDYFDTKACTETPGNFDELLKRINDNLSKEFTAAKNAADSSADRGAKRILTWSEKVTNLLFSLIERYKKEGNAFAEGTNVYVCDICGFVYIGSEPPAVCPVCKVPGFKIAKIERGN